MDSLDSVKLLRKKFGLTQSQLAKKANVSQSLIAKVESKRIDPTYSNVVKIMDVLNHMNTSHNKKVSDVMNKKIIFVSSNELVKAAVAKMKQYAISQLPVIDKHVVGMISDSAILHAINEGKEISSLKVFEVMSESPPVVPESSSLEPVLSLLQYYPLVLVISRGKRVGVVTKADVLRTG